MITESPFCRSNEDTIIHCDAANPTNAITKSQARLLTKSVAYGLRHNFGIGRNGPGKDVVVCISSGQVLLPIIFYGVVAAGGLYSAASTSFTARELSIQIKQGSANWIFCSDDVMTTAREAALKCGIPLTNVVVVKSAPRWSMVPLDGNASFLVSNRQLNWDKITDPRDLRSSTACLIYSSGTT